MPNRKRIRRKYGQINKSYFQELWNAYEGTYLESALFSHRGDDYEEAYMADYVTKGRWHYQDCTDLKVRGLYLYQPQSGPPVYTCNPTQQAFGGPLGGRCLLNYPLSRIVTDSNIYETVHPRSIDDPQSIKILEDTFASNTLPVKWNVDVDPFDTGFSIWYLLVDLLSFKQLYKQLFSSQAINRRFQRLDDIGPSATARALADDHLMVQFGIIPTVADIQDFSRVLTTWRDKYDRMAENMDKTRPWYSDPVDLVPTIFTASADYVGASGIAQFGMDNSLIAVSAHVETTASFHRTASYSFRCPEFQGWMARLRQFVDAFGILDPAALWDVVPWSFVVDWFYGIGQWLHKNRPRLFPAEVIIRDYCESIKVTDTITWRASWLDGALDTEGKPFNLTDVVDQAIALETRTSYVRRQFRPPTNTFKAPQFKPSFVTVRRSLISSALLAQKLCPRH